MAARSHMLVYVKSLARSTLSRQLPPKPILHPFFSSSTPTATRLTKKQCVFLLQSCKSMRQLKQIHCQILMSQLDQNRDVMDDLFVFCTNPEAGDLAHAEKAFNGLKDPSLFVYNLMIKALSKRGDSKRAILLFGRMVEGGLAPDNFTYPFVLKAFGNLRAVSEGKRTHGYIVKTGMEFDPYVRNSLIDMYAELGSIETSRLLFDETPERGVICWNVLISGYVKCERFEDATSVFLKMESMEVKPDEATLVSTLSACISSGNLELGRKIHRYVEEKSRFSMPISNALLDLYAKCSCVDEARGFFDDMHTKNVISWTTMVAGYVNSGRLDEARELFDRSPARDVVLWTAMINGYVQYSRFDEALSLFKEMQMRRIKPDKFTVVGLLTVCANLGALEQGRWIHAYIEDNQIRIDAIVGTALLDMYAKCGYIDRSLEIFRIIDQKDSATWTSMICGLAMNGQTRRALELFSEMISAGVEPDDITYIGVLSACTHGGLVDEGRCHFYAMQQVHQIEPKLEHYGCLVDLLGRAGLLDEAEKLIRSIPDDKGEDVLPLWGALIGACRTHGNVEMVERLARQVAGAESSSSSSGIHILIANTYAAAERWEDVTRVRRKMKDLGVKKTPGCSSIEVNGTIHEFLVGDASHPERKEIYSVLNNLIKVLDLEEKIATDIRLLQMVVTPT